MSDVLDRLRCARCGERGEKWVSHTLECLQETRRIVEEEITKIGREPVTVVELLAASVSAAEEGSAPFGALFGSHGLVIAQAILAGRGLPTGIPVIEYLEESPPATPVKASGYPTFREEGLIR